MSALSTIDIVIIFAYLAITMGVGLWMARTASQSLDHYYLGGRSLPWYMLGMAGMAMWFDLTGTMIITAFLYMLGPKGLFVEFRGGAVLILAFLICYTGKWHRRSGCMTGAEWIAYRFGIGAEAKWMRVFKAASTFIITIVLLAYLVRGTSLFVGMFVPISPMVVTGLILGSCAIYTMISGFYGVVLTDVVQGAIVLVACVIISVMAFNLVPDVETIGEIAEEVTTNTTWTESMPRWETEMPSGFEDYQFLIWIAFFYLLRNVLYGPGTGDENRYFGAKSDRDCGLQSMLQGVTVAFRWPMMMGFAILGLFLIQNLFPEINRPERAAAIIKEYHPELEESWEQLATEIAGSEQNPELVAKLEAIYGKEGWREALTLSNLHSDARARDAAVEIRKYHPEVDASWDAIKTSVVSGSSANPQLVAELEEIYGEGEWQERLSRLDAMGSGQTQEAAAAIKEFHPEIIGRQGVWNELTTSIIRSPEKYDPALIQKLVASLGEDWQGKLTVVSYHGTVNPEQILPAVLLNSIPSGLRGILIVAMLAAMMSTLTGEVNKTSAQFVKDIYKVSIRKNAGNRELIGAAYVSTAFIVIASFVLGIYANSIDEIWKWFLMGLTAGSIGPYVLRLYWWRCNAWGQIGGTVLGGLAAVIQYSNYPELDQVPLFLLMTSISVIGTVGLSYLTPATPMPILKNFYKTTRPFGLWGPLKRQLDPEEYAVWRKEHRNDIIAVPFVMLAQITIFLLPMQLMIKAYGSFFATLPIFLFAAAGVYWFWWRNLAPSSNPGTDRADPFAFLDDPDYDGPRPKAGKEQLRKKLADAV